MESRYGRRNGAIFNNLDLYSTKCIYIQHTIFTLNKIVFVFNKIAFTFNKILFTFNKTLFTFNKILFIFNKTIFTFNKTLFIFNKTLFTSNKILFTFNKTYCRCNGSVDKILHKFQFLKLINSFDRKLINFLLLLDEPIRFRFRTD